MNYYEQFYDDLEFEPEDGHYGRRDSHFYPRDDPYRGDPYRDENYMDDPYYREDPYYHDDPYYRDGHFPPEHERERHRHDRELPEFHRHREEYGVSSGDRPPRGHNHDHHHRGRGRINSDRGNNRGRGNGAVKRIVERGLGISDRGRGSSDRGRGFSDRGRGFNDRGCGFSDRGHRGAKGGMKSMTFVKASSTDNVSNNRTSGSENKDGKGPGSDQIRFDYKAFQNEPSQVEKEVEQALKAYKCQLGFGYGYGPRADLIDGEQPEWLIGDEGATGIPSLSGPGPPGLGATGTQAEESSVEASLHTAQAETENEAKYAKVAPPKNNVKTAMVNPAFNFVKAKSEFHSIDVAFHETEKVQALQPTPNHLSVNFGNKRVGLGFGVSANKTGVPDSNMSTKLHSGLKGGTNIVIDAKFARLQEAVKVRNLPNKNAIEILHMAVDKVKMGISDDIVSSGRTPTGQPMFLCKLIIDGVSIAQGQATAKKAAKHEAYLNALKVFGNQSLTVKEISKDVFELRQKNIEFKVPSTVASQEQKQNLKSPLVTNTSKSNSVSKAAQNNVSGSNNRNTPSGPSTYTKPKIVFHQPSHPLNDKLLEFQGERPIDGPTGSKNAEALAIKLLNFVKEGQTASSDDNKGTSKSGTFPGSGISSGSGTYPGPRTSTGPQRSMKPNPRKRPAQLLYDARKVKSQRVGNVNKQHELEDLSEFIIVDTTGLADTNDKLRDVQILHGSANFNRVVLKLEYEEGGFDVGCSLMLADFVVSSTQGATKEEAKVNAAKEALEYLRECCYTIIVKQQVDSDAAGLTKEQLLSDIQKSEAAAGGGGGGGNPNAAIPDSNIGNLLLRKMGWVGGGVGKDGKGRAEPVQAEMIIGREGLGLSAEKGLCKNFNEKVSKLLQDYIKSDDQRDLHFSSELSKEERAVIHKMGQKLGLKTQSKGSKTGNDRYLIISRKRSARELLEHVKGSGGSTSKYDLIPPRNPDFDVTRREDICHGHSKM